MLYGKEETPRQEKIRKRQDDKGNYVFSPFLALTDVETGGSDCEASQLSPGLADSKSLLFGRWLRGWSW